jgi:hypothetical protein
MDAIISAKRRWSNRLEGVALTATLLALPIMTSLALIGRLAGDLIFGIRHDNVILMLITTSLSLGLTAPLLASTTLYEPLFYDASLSLSDKFARWLTQPSTSPRLLTMLLMLLVLAVAVLSVG